MTTIPTIGFNVESLTYKNVTLNVWDLGGQTTIRPYWRCYYAGGMSGLLSVVLLTCCGKCENRHECDYICG